MKTRFYYSLANILKILAILAILSSLFGFILPFIGDDSAISINNANSWGHAYAIWQFSLISLAISLLILLFAKKVQSFLLGKYSEELATRREIVSYLKVTKVRMVLKILFILLFITILVFFIKELLIAVLG